MPHSQRPKKADRTLPATGKKRIIVAPSVLAADLACLERDIRRAEQAGADVLHVDIMDGAFVPNISFGPNIVQTLNRLTRLPLDVHLMVAAPQHYLAAFAEAGADFLTVHGEACPHLHRVLEEIRHLKVKAGVALNPATPLDTVSEVWPYLDLLLLMTVNPGFGGQSFIRTVLPKIAAARGEIDRRRATTILAVDGGIHDRTIPDVVRAGATQLVMGTYCFTATDMTATIAGVRKLCSTI
jgi:ribulose-phosphate 3-epimerase